MKTHQAFLIAAAIMMISDRAFDIGVTIFVVEMLYMVFVPLEK